MREGHRAHLDVGALLGQQVLREAGLWKEAGLLVTGSSGP